jgi:hypothetical protein
MATGIEIGAQGTPTALANQDQVHHRDSRQARRAAQTRSSIRAERYLDHSPNV